mgnify:FL=1
MLELFLHGYDITKELGVSFYAILFLIVFDVITGVLVAGKERKVNSSINREGLLRKLGELLAVVFVTFVDVYLNANGVITHTGVALLVIYEVMSVVENFSRLGIDLTYITQFFDDEKVKERKKE